MLIFRTPWLLDVSAASALVYYRLYHANAHALVYSPIPIKDSALDIVYFIAATLVLLAGIKLLQNRSRKAYLRTFNSVIDIRQLDWSKFEELVASAFVKEGYAATLSPQGTDGGIDIILKKRGRVHIVQCKHFKKQKVGVKVVREMFGVMVGMGASTCIVVCSGAFTKDAKAFAKGKPIRLIDGPSLIRMIGD